MHAPAPVLAPAPAAVLAPARAISARRERLVAIGLMCGAFVCFSGLDASAKWLGAQGMHPLQTVWARYAVSVALVCVFINPWRVPGLLRTKRPVLQLGRSALLLLSTALNFVALNHLRLDQTVSIQFLAPLLVALLAWPLLGERVGPRRVAAILVGFLGILVITRPGLEGFHPAALLSLASAVTYAIYNVATRLLASDDSSRTTMFYSGLVGALALTPLLPGVWTSPGTPLVWAVMLGTGLFGAVGHWLLILAHAKAPASLLAAFIYSQIIWMAGLGYLVFGDQPDGWTVVGSGIVIASGLYILHRERVRRGGG